MLCSRFVHFLSIQDVRVTSISDGKDTNTEKLTASGTKINAIFVSNDISLRQECLQSLHIDAELQITYFEPA